MWLLLGLAGATFVSEEAACVTAGLLIRDGTLNATAGVAACAGGILLGDWGLWLAGRLGGRVVLSTRWIAPRFPIDRADDSRRWLERRGAAAIVASRFLPGTRLPLYVTSGIVGVSPLWFALWTAVAVLLWTPALVLGAAWTGEALSARVSFLPGGGWASALLSAAAVVLMLKLWGALALPSSRRQLSARVARWRRWEFWPMWLFYAPVALWVALLAVRHRGLSTITAANPGLPDGGIVGESKFEILSKLPADCTVPAVLLPSGAGDARLRTALAEVSRLEWPFPLILKPDVGQRGVGVRLIRDVDAMREYLARCSDAVLLQPYHEGPHEAGVFYYRPPGRRTGRILSITHKEFPVLVGDGISTVEDLVFGHPRYRLQAHVFLQRHRDATRRVLASGERLTLAVAGNHAQGTTFRDGSHLWSEALEARIDGIAHSYPGFCIGRFDIRYRDVEAFRAGRDLAIVELNGTTAEPTDLYDPDRTLIAAYRSLFRHWSLVFAIGEANRARGAPVSSWRRLLGLLRAHVTARPAFD